jgi:isopentenyl diphosphate isomerase/L-lactate dehydrogenase-like FMN-dependent dehydrogenase
VEYETRTTGFEAYDLPYRALPQTDLGGVDLTTEFLGRRLRAPLLIGAMTGAPTAPRRSTATSRRPRRSSASA